MATTERKSKICKGSFIVLLRGVAVLGVSGKNTYYTVQISKLA